LDDVELLRDRVAAKNAGELADGEPANVAGVLPVTIMGDETVRFMRFFD